MSTPAKPAGNIWGMLLLLLITLLLIFLVPRRAQRDSRKVVRAQTYEEIIREEAKAQGVDGNLLVEVARCESELKHHGISGDSGMAAGIYQFHLGTFNEFKEKTANEDFSIFNPQHQIKLAVWAAKKGLMPQHWVTCYEEATVAIKH